MRWRPTWPRSSRRSARRPWARWSRRTATGTAPSPWPAPPWGPGPGGWRWPSPPRVRRCGPPASMHRCSCCPSRAPTSSTTWSSPGCARRCTPSAPSRRRPRRWPGPPARVAELVAAVAERPELVLEGLWTHCAVADEPGNPFTATQLDRFDEVAGALEAAAARPPVVHAANSAAALDHPRARHDLVRCGITVYGLDPSAELAGRVPLQPAMSLVAEVSAVRVVAAGEAVSYGLRRPVPVDSVVATVPLGYADGVPRRLSAVGGEVVIGGARRPLAGTVTIGQLLVD